ncbi:uncharacterized protein LAJ45_06757 [Morchella importuna]|nr:uncharacterized protein LAJ45_06757 [Morchella importuna]KAH8149218.1 hypothetical protein LAJ45_06757 [Morchella importuna]
MSCRPLLRPLRPFTLLLRPTLRTPRTPAIPRRHAHSPADDPNFTSILDQPPTLIRSGRKKHGPGLLILAAIPITAFALGTWQLQRLDWKTRLITTYTERLLRDPLPLPPHINTALIPEFDYRRVLATGRFRHDQEMLLGPRVREGENGYLVITPLERENGSTILVNRGWIAKEKKEHKSRAPEALPRGEVQVLGLMRMPWKRNMFTPPNAPEKGEFYFPDVAGMARLVGAQEVWVEETTDPDYIAAMDHAVKGIPIARAAEVNIRNNHMQYIFTWYGLSLATSVMFYILVKRPPPDITKRVRQSGEWA